MRRRHHRHTKLVKTNVSWSHRCFKSVFAVPTKKQRPVNRKRFSTSWSTFAILTPAKMAATRRWRNVLLMDVSIDSWLAVTSQESVCR